MIAGTLLVLCSGAPARADQPAAGADSTFKPQGSFYVELLGSAIIYSFNYDYRMARHFALRAGVEAWGGSGGAVFAIPVTASALFGRGKGCLEIGGGPVFLGGAGDVEDFDGEVLISTFVAFRLQPPESGFMMRAGIGPVFDSAGEWLIWPALSFGYSF
jgi:hypothetical protein